MRPNPSATAIRKLEIRFFMPATLTSSPENYGGGGGGGGGGLPPPPTGTTAATGSHTRHPRGGAALEPGLARGEQPCPPRLAHRTPGGGCAARPRHRAGEQSMPAGRCTVERNRSGHRERAGRRRGP